MTSEDVTKLKDLYESKVKFYKRLVDSCCEGQRIKDAMIEMNTVANVFKVLGIRP